MIWLMLICPAKLKLHGLKDYISLFTISAATSIQHLQCSANGSDCQNSSSFNNMALTYLQSSLIQHEHSLGFFQIYIFCLISEHPLIIFILPHIVPLYQESSLSSFLSKFQSLIKTHQILHSSFVRLGIFFPHFLKPPVSLALKLYIMHLGISIFSNLLITSEFLWLCLQSSLVNIYSQYTTWIYSTVIVTVVDKIIIRHETYLLSFINIKSCWENQHLHLIPTCLMLFWKNTICRYWKYFNTFRDLSVIYSF